ncbi:MAG: hypothetical protein ACK56I_08425 [bacterium]
MPRLQPTTKVHLSRLRGGGIRPGHKWRSLQWPPRLRAYATMMNTLDASALELLLADDFHYASQWVFDEIKSKDAYLEYITAKLEPIR